MHKRYTRIFLSAVMFFCIAFGKIQAQVPANKPSGVMQTPAVTGQIVVTPGGYPVGIPLNNTRVRQAVAPITDEAVFDAAGYQLVKEQTQYFDGLGRPLQIVFKQASPGTSPQDIVTPLVYDAFGREAYKYMPYVAAATDGSFKTDPFNAQKAFLQSQYPGEQVFYGKINYEASPFNRVQTTFAAGNSWAGSEGTSAEHSMKTQYLVNTATDLVKIWTITNSALMYNGNEPTVNIPATALNYNAGTLYKTVTIDEQGSAVVEYKDNQGQIILKKVQVDASMAADYSGYNGFLSTYYVYDDLNQLRFVIPPKAVAELIKPVINWVLSAEVINELCFRYEYDDRNRMTAKKVPGAGWVYMLYDKRDRLVYTQDANMRISNQWMTTLYDELNRPVTTGMTTYSGTRTQLKTYLDAVDPSITSTKTITGNAPLRVEGFYTLTTPITGIRQATSYISMENGFETTDFTAEIVSGGTGDAFSNQSVITGNPIPAGASFIPLTITSYDNYSWTTSAYTTQYNSKLQEGNNVNKVTMPAQASQQTSGLVTGTRTRVIEDATDLTKGGWLTAINFYDDRNRVIQQQSVNYKGGKDISTNLYDFSGKVLSNYMATENPAATLNIGIRSNMEYDAGARLLKTAKSIFNNPADASAAVVTTTAQLLYDQLGQLLTKTMGQQKEANGNYTSTPLETLDYSYNIRGWLKGVNKDYSNKTGTHANDRWFGMELNYDWGYASNQFNGNIAGTKWRTKGDGEQRSYGFGYDKVNRLLSADFSQLTGANYTDNVNNLNFDMQMGNGTDPLTAYDENGNIKAMKQWGLKGLASSVIDDLTYTYIATSNKLFHVADANNDMDSKLGDFKDISFYSGRQGKYIYDANGNMVMDTHKGIYSTFTTDNPGITYNYQNLPWQIKIMSKEGQAKGTISYIYDATGNKLEKRVNELPSASNNNQQKSTNTSYITGLVYENNALQLISMEEGRIRQSTSTIGTNRYVFDYFIKDHLGNTRMVLTDEQQIDRYPTATLEANALGQEKNYYDINDTYVVPKPGGTSPANLLDYVNDNGTNNPNTFADKNAVSQKMYKLNAATNRIGLTKMLKVMAGDKINILAKSYYRYAGGSVTNTPFNAGDLINGFLAVAGGNNPATLHGATSAILNADASLLAPLNSFTNNNPVNSGNNVKAAVNYIILDEYFKYISGNFDPVESASSGGLKPHLLQDIPVTKNGYIYIYCSNESNIDVFFDNLEVVHTRGPLLEETQYYPFGLTMDGISSKAVNATLENKYKYNKSSYLQNKEFSDGNGLELYATNFRSLDPQLGRWWQIDPKPNEAESPYDAMGNNPIKFNDPLGDTLPSGKHVYDKGGMEEFLWMCDPRSEYYGTEVELTWGERLYLLGGQIGLFAMPVGGRILSAAEQTVTKTTNSLNEIGSLWKIQNVSRRGFRAENILGGNLPKTFKTFDRFIGGVASSIKSLDLGAKSYNKGNGLLNTIKGYVNDAANFTNYAMRDESGALVSLSSSQINSRTVELAIQPAKATLQQWEQIVDAMKYGQDNGVAVNINFIR